MTYWGGGISSLGSAFTDWYSQTYGTPWGQPTGPTTSPSPYEQYQQAGELEFYPTSQYPNAPYSLGEGFEWVTLTHDPTTGAPLPGGESWVKVPSDVAGEAGTDALGYGLSDLEIEQMEAELEYLRARTDDLLNTGQLTPEIMAELDLAERQIEARLYEAGLESQTQMSNIEMLRQKYYNEFYTAQQGLALQGAQWYSGLQAQPKNWIERWYAENLPFGAEMPQGLAGAAYPGWLEPMQYQPPPMQIPQMPTMPQKSGMTAEELRAILEQQAYQQRAFTALQPLASLPNVTDQLKNALIEGIKERTRPSSSVDEAGWAKVNREVALASQIWSPSLAGPEGGWMGGWGETMPVAPRSPTTFTPSVDYSGWTSPAAATSERAWDWSTGGWTGGTPAPSGGGGWPGAAPAGGGWSAPAPSGGWSAPAAATGDWTSAAAGSGVGGWI